LQEKKTSKLFVYGTLKKGFNNHRIIEGSKYLGMHWLNNYGIFDLGFYPGIRPRQGGVVYGELYEIDDELFPRLDRLEGTPYLYTRETEFFHRDDKDNPCCSGYVYVYASDTSEDWIEDGSWPEKALSAA